MPRVKTYIVKGVVHRERRDNQPKKLLLDFGDLDRVKLFGVLDSHFTDELQTWVPPE